MNAKLLLNFINKLFLCFIISNNSNIYIKIIFLIIIKNKYYYYLKLFLKIKGTKSLLHIYIKILLLYYIN